MGGFKLGGGWFQAIAPRSKYFATELLNNPPTPPCPCCRIVAENFLEGWWRDLEETLTTDKHVDAASIHRIMA